MPDSPSHLPELSLGAVMLPIDVSFCYAQADSEGLGNADAVGSRCYVLAQFQPIGIV